MEGQQGGDLDPGTGRDTQVTEAGGAFYLFIYFHYQNSCGMHGGAKESDGGVKIGGCDDCQGWSLPNVWVLHTRSHCPQI